MLLKRFALAGMLIAAMIVVPVQGVASGAPRSQANTSGGTATFAEAPGTPPTYIFPLVSAAHSANSDITQFQPLMWLPLYWVGHPTSSAATVNYKLSLADPPSVSNRGKTLTMHLKHYVWSTGAPVTGRDVVFWMNLLLNEKTNYAGYAAGDWMTHVASYSAPSPQTFVLNMNLPYNLTYLIYTGLADITPMPQQAWDRTSASGAVGTYDVTASGAKDVYNYLNSRSLALATWATTPLWQVVDGPWHLQPKTGFRVNGQVTMIPNKRYSGENKPKIKKFEELPFTSVTAEYDALRSGAVDYGYVPVTDVGTISTLKSQGFSIRPWYGWAISVIALNMANPQYRAMFSQLYIRQAMQSMINQRVYIRTLLKGYGVPTYGPVPLVPRTPFLSARETKNPYPYSPKRAERLLSSHGWRIEPGKSDVCVRAGTTERDCGAGVAAGSLLSIPLLYATGSPAVDDEIQVVRSTFAKVGIKLQLSPEPVGTVFGAITSCLGAQAVAHCPANSPALSNWGSPSYFYVPDFFALATNAFECDGTSNVSDYCNREVDKLYAALSVEQNPAKELTDIHALESVLSSQLPALWFPESAYQISAISGSLRGVVSQDSTSHIYPETWSLRA